MLYFRFRFILLTACNRTDLTWRGVSNIKQNVEQKYKTEHYKSPIETKGQNDLHIELKVLFASPMSTSHWRRTRYVPVPQKTINTVYIYFVFLTILGSCISHKRHPFISFYFVTHSGVK